MTNPMRITRIQFHHAGFDDLRRTPEVAAELHRRGEAIAQAAGGAPDFVVQAELTKSRARVVVVAATAKGQAAEARNHVLTTALDAGRSS